jgi:hypothetical protein
MYGTETSIDIGLQYREFVAQASAHPKIGNRSALAAGASVQETEDWKNWL